MFLLCGTQNVVTYICKNRGNLPTGLSVYETNDGKQFDKQDYTFHFQFKWTNYDHEIINANGFTKFNRNLCFYGLADSRWFKSNIAFVKSQCSMKNSISCIAIFRVCEYSKVAEQIEQMNHTWMYILYGTFVVSKKHTTVQFDSSYLNHNNSLGKIRNRQTHYTHTYCQESW